MNDQFEMVSLPQTKNAAMNDHAKARESMAGDGASHWVWLYSLPGGHNDDRITGSA